MFDSDGERHAALDRPAGASIAHRRTVAGVCACKRPAPSIGPRRCAAFAVSAVVLLPVLSLAYVALSGSGEDWPHLVANRAARREPSPRSSC